MTIARSISRAWGVFGWMVHARWGAKRRRVAAHANEPGEAANHGRRQPQPLLSSPPCHTRHRSDTRPATADWPLCSSPSLAMCVSRRLHITEAKLRLVFQEPRRWPQRTRVPNIDSNNTTRLCHERALACAAVGEFGHVSRTKTNTKNSPALTTERPNPIQKVHVSSSTVRVLGLGSAMSPFVSAMPMLVPVILEHFSRAHIVQHVGAYRLRPVGCSPTSGQEHLQALSTAFHNFTSAHGIHLPCHAIET